MVSLEALQNKNRQPLRSAVFQNVLFVHAHIFGPLDNDVIAIQNVAWRLVGWDIPYYSRLCSPSSVMQEC